MKRRVIYKISFCLILFSFIFSEYTGYLRQTDSSFCMDECSEYFLQNEDGTYISNISFLNQDSSIYLNRFVQIEGEEIWCIECEAIEVNTINLSNDCENPVNCFVDPCEVAPECQLNTPVDCVSNYCGGCYADFYDLEGNLVDCYNQEIEQCYDVGGLFFGLCDMYMGVAIVDGECEGISGCGWTLDGIDYSNAFFDNITECENNCINEFNSCEDIEYDYNQLFSSEEILECQFNNDCSAVWGDCGVGLGGCHYAVNDSYPINEINHLVDMWIEYDCMEWVCDCASLPNVTCNDGNCELAYCYDINPAGCFNSGCPEFYECVVLEEDCVPSTCFCDEFYGDWYCTEDCGGGTCINQLNGDVNYDGMLNVSDIIIIVNMILLVIDVDLIADMNHDNQVNIIDVVTIVNYILN